MTTYWIEGSRRNFEGTSLYIGGWSLYRRYKLDINIWWTLFPSLFLAWILREAENNRFYARGWFLLTNLPFFLDIVSENYEIEWYIDCEYLFIHLLYTYLYIYLYTLNWILFEQNNIWYKLFDFHFYSIFCVINDAFYYVRYRIWINIGWHKSIFFALIQNVHSDTKIYEIFNVTYLLYCIILMNLLHIICIVWCHNL